MGKSILNKLVCLGILGGNVGSVLVFDMHGEHPLSGMAKNNSAAFIYEPRSLSVGMTFERKSSSPDAHDARRARATNEAKYGRSLEALLKRYEAIADPETFETVGQFLDYMRYKGGKKQSDKTAANLAQTLILPLMEIALTTKDGYQFYQLDEDGKPEIFKKAGKFQGRPKLKRLPDFSEEDVARAAKLYRPFSTFTQRDFNAYYADLENYGKTSRFNYQRRVKNFLYWLSEINRDKALDAETDADRKMAAKLSRQYKKWADDFGELEAPRKDIDVDGLYTPDENQQMIDGVRLPLEQPLENTPQVVPMKRQFSSWPLRDEAWIALYAALGPRPIEFAYLRIQDVTPDEQRDDMAWISIEEDFQQKRVKNRDNGHPRTVPIVNGDREGEGEWFQVVDRLKAWIANHPLGHVPEAPLFLTFDPRKKKAFERGEGDLFTSPDSISSFFQTAAERAGIDKPIDAYTLRHSRADWLHKTGWSLENIARLLGTSVRELKDTYTHWTNEEEQNEVLGEMGELRGMVKVRTERQAANPLDTLIKCPACEAAIPKSWTRCKCGKLLVGKEHPIRQRQDEKESKIRSLEKAMRDSDDKSVRDTLYHMIRELQATPEESFPTKAEEEALLEKAEAAVPSREEIEEALKE